MNLKNKRILVTGGSLGIGKATAKMMIEKGAQVVITGRDKDRIEAAANEIGAIPLVFDVSDSESIEKKAKESLELLGGGIDVLLNNAGIGEFGLLGEITKDQFERIFNTNVFGLALLTQAFLPVFKAQQSGSIINIGSSAAVKGFAHGTVYAASKFAVRAMTQCWQAELRKDNIRVFLVNPSEVTTAFNQTDRQEREDVGNKLTPVEIAHTIITGLEMNDRGFIPETNIWATNPF
ncbi:MAG: SDR family oxidoreductase [Putridiphycobacter sp.]|nr:SDR family oxidoreductase [Putridiphycobacter sp.]